MVYYCYIVECTDGSYYTGWSLDPVRRATQHNKGTGAKYTRLRRPVILVYIEELTTRSEAMKREHRIKNMTHLQKKELVNKYTKS